MVRHASSGGWRWFRGGSLVPVLLEWFAYIDWPWRLEAAGAAASSDGGALRELLFGGFQQQIPWSRRAKRL
jgi:hypothetical protein